MDPVTLALVGLGFAIAAGAVVVFYWTKILRWAQSSLLPWVTQHMPDLEKFVKNAFVAVDKVAAPTRAMAKDAWQRLRQVLLRHVQKFEQLPNGTWRVRITSWLRETIEELGSAEPLITEITTERQLTYDELPPEVRADWLRQGFTTRELDVTEVRDKELLELSA